MKFYYEEKRNRDLHLNISHSLPFEAHIHESVEIIYMLKGTAHAFAGGKECTLKSGDFFIVFPNKVHYYDNCVNNLAIVAIIPLSMLPEFRGILTTSSPLSPLIQDVSPEAGRLFELMNNYDGKYKNEAVRGMILSAVSMLMEKITLSEEKEFDETALCSILKYCEDNYSARGISLEAASKSLGISKSYISHIFSDKIHISFRDYINSLRLEKTLQLLKNDNLSITEIAYESGFETIRTFNRAFKKKFSISPAAYKKQIF